MENSPEETTARVATSNKSFEELFQREQWVRDVIALMAIVITAATAIITIGALAGWFPFQQIIPIYILLALIIPAWFVVRRGGWRWARYVPVLMCFSMGVYSSINNGFESIFVLFYFLAVLLAGMLHGSRLAIITILASGGAYVGAGLWHDGYTANALANIITFLFGLLGIAVLQWYIFFRLLQVFRAQNAISEALKVEIGLRRQAEQNQAEQERQIRRLAENTTDLVTELDAHGLIRYASPSYRTGLGYEPEVLLGSDSLEMVHPADRQEITESMDAAAVTHGHNQVQVRVRHADGHYVYEEISGNPLYDDSGNHTGFVLTGRDISRQKQAETAIQESEKKFRAIIEALPLGFHMYTLEEDGSLIFRGYNPAANNILGIDHAQHLGKSIESAFPGLAATNIPDGYREVARTGVLWQIEQVDYSRQPIEGAFEVHAFQPAPRTVAAIFSDISQRINAAEALRLSEEKFSSAFLTSPDPVNINRLSDGVYIDINHGFTALTGFERQDVIGKSSLSPELNIWVDPDDRARLVRGLLEHGVVNNLEARFRFKNGIIHIGSMSARVIEVNHEKCILSITRDITARIQAEKELREAHAKLEQAYEATLQGWAFALGLRERETANHSLRVVEYTMQMAKALGISGEELINIRRGALLHDIGKMGVPDEILLKPGRLTPDEWVIMRQHTEFGRAMLQEIEYLRKSIDIPFYHHEKWNGSGYPEGLKGEAIPLGARIFAIADVYDALTHDRPYRPAWPSQAAKNYLVEQCGIQFDPKIVEIFLSLEIS